MTSKKDGEYCTPEELISLYPQAEQRGWTAVKIGIAYKMGLLIGYHHGKERKNLIQVISFRELLIYANGITRKKIIELDDDE